MVEEDAAGEKRFAPYVKIWLADNPIPEFPMRRAVAAMKRAGARVHVTGP